MMDQQTDPVRLVAETLLFRSAVAELRAHIRACQGSIEDSYKLLDQTDEMARGYQPTKG